MPPLNVSSRISSCGYLSFPRRLLLSRYLHRSRLYPTCEWEPKHIRRLIGNGQLAARLRGSDSRLTKTDRECPICFMYYTESNVAKW